MKKLKIYFQLEIINLLWNTYALLLRIPLLAIPVLFANIFIIDTSYIRYLTIDIILVFLILLYNGFLGIKLKRWVDKIIYTLELKLEAEIRLDLLINTNEEETILLWTARVFFLLANVLQGLIFYVFIIALGVCWHSIKYGEYMEYVAIAFIYGIIPPISIMIKLQQWKNSLKLQRGFIFDIIVGVLTVVILVVFFFLVIYFFK